MHCLVIGATGYVGARLVPRLLGAGHVVRVLARDARKVAARPWGADVEIHVGDVADPVADADACRGVDAVFYLVHMMDATGRAEFRRRDLEAATTLARAAAGAGVGRIVYLGGLQPGGGANSAHLASRHEVGEAFLASGVPTAVLQAGIVIGSGSASYEMLRHLASSSPVLPLPAEAYHTIQPIAIDDVLYHLLACLDLPAEVNTAFDIGGADVLTYRDMLVRYAAAAGLPLVAVPVPVGVPRVAAALAVESVTPVDRYLAGPLLESMAYDLECRGEPPTGAPPGGPTTYDEAVRRALAGEGAAAPMPADPTGFEFVSERIEHVAAPVDALWAVLSGIGGKAGWYTVPGVWELRGKIDQLFGGIGARRARPEKLAPGAALDWWRVEAVEEGRMLRLLAEAKVPGIARLEMRAEPDGRYSRYVQRTTFEPTGLPGRVYWYAQLPAHAFVFAVMARTIAGVAEKGITRPT
ncbi:MAG: SDR family oxidoreductase [Pseudonocardia sp.]|nr:SDR family oxidoreductase [Pseudonocardia sp.]